MQLTGLMTGLNSDLYSSKQPYLIIPITFLFYFQIRLLIKSIRAVLTVGLTDRIMNFIFIKKIFLFKIYFYFSI